MVEPLFVFTVAPTGLGHIRVMHALQDGLPLNTTFEVIGIQEAGVNNALHSLGSRVPLLTDITEFYQTNHFAEWVVSALYTAYLKSHAKEAMVAFADIVKRNPDRKRWIVISTHFALAFSIAASKKEIAEKFGVEVLLCVIVTDDSPQRVWVVKDADLIFAPSTLTGETLVKLGMSPEKVKVVSYPISPKFAQKLSKDEYQHVVDQLNADQTTPLQIVIPISGAAVQLPYLEDIIRTLSYENFFFTVIGQDSTFTFSFFQDLAKLTHVQTSIGLSNHQTVEYYESLFYQPSRPAVEITKPSEQSFKAILQPNERGGVILLFTQPVERQEKDNLRFLQRYGLMPDDNQQHNLEDFLLGVRIFTTQEVTQIHALASHWRAIRLPSAPQKAAQFIKKLKEKGIFSSMLKYVPSPKPELMSNGVEMIWNEILTRFNGTPISETVKSTKSSFVARETQPGLVGR